MKKIFSVFNNSNYTKLFYANFTSQMGSTIGLTAFMFYLLDRFSTEPYYATITELMFSLPTLAVFFLVGVFADRFDRQQIAQSCDWMCTVLSLAFLGALYIDWLPLIFVLLFLRSAIKNFFGPAESALVQGILANDDYTAAAGLNQMVGSLFMLFGNGLGVFCYWTIGIEGAIAIDAASFLISGLLIRSCKISEAVRMPNGRHSIRGLNLSNVWSDFMIGMKYILKHRLLLSLIAGFILFGIVNGGFSVMQVFILKYKLAPKNYEEYSVVIGVVFGLGVLAGSLAASILAKSMKLYQMLILGLLLAGTATAASAIVDSFSLYLAVSCVVSLSLPMINIAIGGWLPHIVDPGMMGRVQGWISPLMMLAQSITLLLIAVLYPVYIKVEVLYYLVGGCLVLVGVYYLYILPRLDESEERTRSSLRGEAML
ncbi:MFS transporter [Peribacillus sp. SCS-155]|uniref:MFS transporter n=1 Tax=Peribacillus sedimenti TaxID=3115297 RepID=UPI003905B8CD